MDKIVIIVLFSFILLGCNKKEKIDVNTYNFVYEKNYLFFDFRKQLLICKIDHRESRDIIKFSKEDIEKIHELFIEDELYKLSGEIHSSDTEYIPQWNDNFKTYKNNKLNCNLYINIESDKGTLEKTPDFERLNHFRKSFFLILKKYDKYNNRINEYNKYYMNVMKRSTQN